MRPLSTSVSFLIATRLLQGTGAALMMPVGRLMMVRSFAKSELLVAMNFVIIPALIGPLLGPLRGGVIVQWRRNGHHRQGHAAGGRLIGADSQRVFSNALVSSPSHPAPRTRQNTAPDACVSVLESW